MEIVSFIDSFINKFLDHIISPQDFPDVYTVGQSKALTKHRDFKSSIRTSGQLSILKNARIYK